MHFRIFPYFHSARSMLSEKRKMQHEKKGTDDFIFESPNETAVPPYGAAAIIVQAFTAAEVCSANSYNFYN